MSEGAMIVGSIFPAKKENGLIKYTGSFVKGSLDKVRIVTKLFIRDASLEVPRLDIISCCPFALYEMWAHTPNLISDFFCLALSLVFPVLYSQNLA